MAIIEKSILDKTIGSKILYTRVTIMTFDFVTVDEITGIVIGNPNFTNDSTSDIRRTCTMELTPLEHIYDITYGGKLWIDKYVKVELGTKKNQEDEITYFNMGVYVIDNPSKVYSITENKITLNCLDIMSRLTGIRGGIIEGITHVIPKNSNIRQTIIAILKEARISKYVVSECEIDVPYDISIDGGSSSYDMLKQLVNLLPNYQIYFDVDGVFHYDLIPNGVNEPVIVDNDIWKEILINYTATYNFEDIKNCIDIIGGTHDNALINLEVTYGSVGASGNITWAYFQNVPSDVFNVINGSPNDASNYIGGYVCIKFPHVDNFTGNILINYIQFPPDRGTITFQTPINITASGNEDNYLYINLPRLTSYTLYNNTWYSCNYDGECLGEYQSRATLYETNHDSSFWDSIDYHCNAIYTANSATIGGQVVDTLNLYIDKPWVDLDTSLRTMVFEYSLSNNSRAPYDLSQVHKTSDGYCWCNYYFKNGYTYTLQSSGQADANLLLRGTSIARYNYGGAYSQKLMKYQPNSLGTLRIVLSGDEYDNIHSNDLAMQRAKFELYQRCRLLDSVNIKVIPQYWLDTNWLIEIQLPNEEVTQYLIKSITTDGGVDGEQTITLMRYYPYYPSIN